MVIKILLGVLIFLLLIAVIFVVSYWYTIQKLRRKGERKIGTIIGIQKSKIPGAMRYHIYWTEGGKNQYGVSQIRFGGRKFKVAAKVPIVIQKMKYGKKAITLTYMLQK